MSKLAVAIAVPALLASVGLGVVCLELSAQVDELKADLADQTETATATPRSDAMARSSSRTGSRREDARVRAMEERLAALETRVVTPAAATPLAEADDGAALAAMEDLPDALRSSDFDRAVRGVLDARDAERRAERQAKMAQSRAKQLLRGLEVDEGLHEQVVAMVSESMRRREELKDAELEREIAREQAAALRDEFQRSLESVLTADQMEKVLPRLESRRGDDRGRRKQQKRDDKRRRNGRDGLGEGS